MEFYWVVRTIVFMEFGLVCGTIVYILASCFTGRFRKHVFWYIYEVPIALLYLHFLNKGPVVVSGDLPTLIYWSAQIGLLPLVITPIICESLWRYQLKTPSKKVSIPKMHMVMVILTLLAMGTVCYIANQEAQLQNLLHDRIERVLPK